MINVEVPRDWTRFNANCESAPANAGGAKVIWAEFNFVSAETVPKTTAPP
jgi:hypothetical protein